MEPKTTPPSPPTPAPAADKRIRPYRINGATMLGRFAAVIADKDGVEIGTISIPVLVLSVWICSLGCFVLTAPFGNVPVSAVSTIFGALAGFLIAMQLHPGKLLCRYSYDEITSFVTSAAELTISTKKGLNYAPHMSADKQSRLLLGISRILAEQGEFYLDRSGAYYRVRRKNEESFDK